MSFYQLDFQGKKYWTHSSFASDDKQSEIRKIEQGVSPVKNGASFLTLLGMTYLSNSLSALSKLPLQYKAAAVVVPALAARFGAGMVYNSGVRSDLNKQFDGLPLWESKFDVPELDKLYFFLDDDNGYKPNLWHHATSNSIKFQAIYQL